MAYKIGKGLAYIITPKLLSINIQKPFSTDPCFRVSGIQWNQLVDLFSLKYDW